MPSINVVPNGDGTVQWDIEPYSPVFDHYTYVDEGTTLGGGTPDDDDYVYTDVADEIEEFDFENTPGDADTITQIDVNIRARISDTTSNAYIRLELFHSGGTPVSGNPKDVDGSDLGGYGSIGETTKSWTGLSLTKAQTDSLEIKMTWKTS